MNFIWVEVYKFLKGNITKIIIGTLVITSLFVLNNYQSNVEKIEDIEEIENNKDDNNTSTTVKELKVNSNPAFFRFYVETQEGYAFTNDILLSQYVTSETLLREASSQTNTKLDTIVEQTDNYIVVDYYESGYSNVIGITKDVNSGVFEFHVNIGNENNNLNIANYYYDLIAQSSIPFLSNKKVYVFVEPKIREFNDEQLPIESEELVVDTTNSILKNIFIGLILGSVFSTGLLIILTFISKKLRYSFSYSIKSNDYFFLVDDKLDYKEELYQLLGKASPIVPVIIIEENINNNIAKRLTGLSEIKEFKTHNSITDINDVNNVERVIYIINENETSRKWYNKQRRLDRMYEFPTIVIQVNN